ncbi:FAD-dependent oxidoreductase [Ructibacterium gallinarum]|uniref:FAD-dependent oxidoreductase n=1 Tax=Ructibacterium gallinarum TaxID=2779355 RepID=A0A9D5M6P9_9FIRM|nr:FAD-dependent oxidoreductase [Ructibacterium gallinarum]MBE5040517.1 FAD-dependent oxidoreductase [Ructibacterium gallinarum]
MEKIMETAREIPVIADVDVLVAGGGPAGIGAALQAARQGVNVMLIESQDCVGGIATAGLMSHWGGRSSSKIMLEIFERTYEKGQAVGWDNSTEASKNAIYHDVQKIVLDEMMAEAGVQLMFYTTAVDARVENGRITGVIVQNKSGRGIIKAKCVIDATGDGDVAAFAGVPYTKGRETDGKMQPCTIMFKVGGVDYDTAVFPESFETKVPTEKGELQALAKELLPFPAGHVLLYKQPTPGTVCCNMTNAIEVDGTDAKSITEGILTCRSQIEPIIKFLREYVPGYQNCWLMSTASLLGIRETRHFEGMASLGEQDILDARYFDNWVVRRAFFNFDVHNLSGASLDETGVQHEWSQQKDYTIPYGCLLPKNVEGLLLSGRNISGSHLAHSNFRVMPICIALGEAAGVAAALSVKENVLLRDVNIKKIQNLVV